MLRRTLKYRRSSAACLNRPAIDNGSGGSLNTSDVLKLMLTLLALGQLIWGCQQRVNPQLDEAQVKKYLGKTVLVGITDLDVDGKPTNQRQFFGTITEISLKNGMILTAKNNSTQLALPPDLSTLLPAKPGDYRLRSTGEVVTDPDFLTTWEFKANDPNKATGKWHRAPE